MGIDIHTLDFGATEAVAGTPLPIQAPWLADALEKVRLLGDLPGGWDTYGSPPITPIERSMGACLAEKAARLDAPAPLVVPVPGGGVQLEWQAGERGLELE